MTKREYPRRDNDPLKKNSPTVLGQRGNEQVLAALLIRGTFQFSSMHARVSNETNLAASRLNPAPSSLIFESNARVYEPNLRSAQRDEKRKRETFYYERILCILDVQAATLVNENERDGGEGEKEKMRKRNRK